MTNKILKIIFADAKLTSERIVCLLSAAFWTWLIFYFIRFFLTYAIGMYYAVSGMYPQVAKLITEYNQYLNYVTFIIVAIIFFWRVPVYKHRVVKYVEVKNIQEQNDSNLPKTESAFTKTAPDSKLEEKKRLAREKKARALAKKVEQENIKRQIEELKVKLEAEE